METLRTILHRLLQPVAHGPRPLVVVATGPLTMLQSHTIQLGLHLELLLHLLEDCLVFGGGRSTADDYIQ